MLQYRQFVFDDWRKRRKYEKTNWLSAPDSYWDESEVLSKTRTTYYQIVKSK